MKRYLTRHLSMAAIAAMTVAMFSCKDDPEPVIPVVSFQQATRTVGEDAGTIDVLLQLDAEAPRDITVRYSVAGTATEGTTSSSDYQVMGTYGELTIAKGSSSGTLQLQIKQDLAVEADETIILTITEIVNEYATVGTTPAITITLQSDDAGSKVSFATATETVKETQGLLNVQLTLDKPAAQDLTVEYAFNYDNYQSGTVALDTIFAESKDIPSRYYDFLVEGGTYGRVTIPANSTTANIVLRIYSDFILEGDETIEMNLKTVSVGGTLGTATKHTITVQQEDGRLIGLLWDPSYTDVDMDMFLWVGEDETKLEDVLFISADASTEVQEEDIFIPKVITDQISDGAFGLSFVYYSGTKTPMNFEVHHVDFANGVAEAEGTREVKAGAYTLANINVWDNATTGKRPQIEQTFKIVAKAYQPVSDITIPTSSSRQATHELPSNLSRVSGAFSKFAPSVVRRLRN